VVVIAQDGVASATITATRTEQSTLAAVGVWGARAAIGGSSFSCQAFDFQDETYQGKSAELKDLGGNLCGCPKPTETCKSVSSGLEPPEPLPAP
jgi:hypothetical protein